LRATSGDREILLDDALRRVDQDERDVGPLRRVQRSQLGVVLDALTVAALAPHPRRVDEHERPLVALEDGVDRVARRAGRLGDDHALAAEDRVQQRRLADVRPAEDRDADRRLGDLLTPLPRQLRDDLVEQVAVPCPCSAESGIGSPSPSRCRSRARLSCAGSSILFAISSTGLRARRRMSATSSSPGVTPARASTTKSTRSASDTACRACTAIDCVSGDWSAMSTPPVSISRNRSFPHSAATPSVARHARISMHDRRARAGQAVDQRRLPHVRKPTDGDRSLHAGGSRREGGPLVQ
jgi:hypothetical protein